MSISEIFVRAFYLQRWGVFTFHGPKFTALSCCLLATRISFPFFFFIICTLLFCDFFFVFLSCFCCVWHANYQVYTITRLQLHRKIVEIFSLAAVVLFFQRPQSTELIRNNNFISHALASLRVLLHLLHLVGD